MNFVQAEFLKHGMPARVVSIFDMNDYIMLADRPDIALETAYRLTQGNAQYQA